MDKLQTIIELMNNRLLEKLGDEVDLIFLYGSFLRGNPHKYSDIDVSFVPVHADRWFSITVLVEEKLFDLYAMHWPTLENMAEFRNPSASVLLEHRIIYQRTPEAAARFTGLAGRLSANLLPEARPKMLRHAQELFQSTAYPFYLLRQAAEAEHILACLQQAMAIYRTVLHCLAVVNQTCVDTRKLPQVLALPKLPARFEESVHNLLHANQPAQLLAACETLLNTTHALLLTEQRIAAGPGEPFASRFDSAYPELKRDLQAILLGCERRDPLEIRGSLVSLYHELLRGIAQASSGVDYNAFNSLQDYEQDFTALGFPALLPALLAEDYPLLYQRCLEFDRQLQTFLTGHGVALNNFGSLDELNRYLSDL